MIYIQNWKKEILKARCKHCSHCRKDDYYRSFFGICDCSVSFDPSFGHVAHQSVGLNNFVCDKFSPRLSFQVVEESVQLSLF